MYRFIMVTFAFLGWSFYEFSGGADYQPRDFSAGARAVIDGDPQDVRVTRLATLENTSVAREDATTTAQDTDMVLEAAVADALRTASQQTGSASLVTDIRAEEDPNSRAFVAGDRPILATATPVSFVAPVATTPQVPDAPAVAVDDALDLRLVNGNRVNLRTGPGTDFGVVTRLSKGTRVEVVSESNGWVQLEVVGDSHAGWVADWLLISES